SADLCMSLRITRGSLLPHPHRWGCSSQVLRSARGRPGAQDQCGQATKGTWGMSWRQEALKGVADCEKRGRAVKRALTPWFPSQPGELKHLSTRWKGKQKRLRQ